LEQARKEKKKVPVGIRRAFVRSEKTKVEREVKVKNHLTEDQMDIEKYLGKDINSTLIEEERKQ